MGLINKIKKARADYEQKKFLAEKKKLEKKVLKLSKKSRTTTMNRRSRDARKRQLKVLETQANKLRRNIKINKSDIGAKRAAKLKRLKKGFTKVSNKAEKLRQSKTFKGLVKGVNRINETNSKPRKRSKRRRNNNILDFGY